MFVKRVALERIRPNPYQPRESVDQEGIFTLAQDIKANGLQQMPAGRAVDAEGKLCTYEDACLVQLAFGHRRWKAYQLLSIDDDQYADLPVQIVTYDDERMALAAWSENESRKNLNPVERARAVLKMIEAFGWTQDQAADKVRVARSTVSNMLRMLRLPEDVLGPLAEGVISERQAMAMMPFYELSSRQRTELLDGNWEFGDFLALARQGMIDSDTIRKKIGDAIEAAWPKPVTPSLLDLTPNPFPSPPENGGRWKGQEEEPTPGSIMDGGEEEAHGWIGVDGSDETGVVSITNESSQIPAPPFSSSSTLPDSGSVEDAPKPREQAGGKEPTPSPSLKGGEQAAVLKTWAESTIMLTVTLMPEEAEHRDNRLAVIGGRVNDGAPMMEQRRLYGMDLGSDLTVLLAQLMDKHEEERK